MPLGRQKPKSGIQEPPAGAEPSDSTNPNRSLGFAIFAAACGFALIVVPFLWSDLSLGLQPFRWPIIVVGLAAIAAALGSQATVKYKVYSAGGTAAIVLIFAWALSPKPSFVWGSIRGTEKFPSAVMMTNSSFLVGRMGDGQIFHFFAREEELRGPIFSITARNTDGALPQQIIIGCIPIDLLKKYLGNSDGLDLTMSPDVADPENPRWKLMETMKPTSIGQWGNPGCIESPTPLKAASLPTRLGNAVIPAAQAGLPAMEPAQPLKLPDEVSLLLAELGNGDFTTQVRTQDRIARLRDAPSIEAIVRAWNEPWKTQVDTGLLVAWVRGIRADRAVAVPIASAMSKAQLDHVVELAGSHDYTVRYNATELLSWMLQSTGWPNGTPATQADIIVGVALKPFTDVQGFFQPAAGVPTASLPNLSAFNAMVALNDAKCSLRSPDRTHAASVLKDFAASPQVATFQLQKTSAAAGQFQNKAC